MAGYAHNNNNNNNKIIHISCIQNGSRKLDKIYIKNIAIHTKNQSFHRNVLETLNNERKRFTDEVTLKNEKEITKKITKIPE